MKSNQKNALTSSKSIVKYHSRGFTLIELMVVLTIISVLLAGVVAGTALIGQAKLQSIVDDITKFKTAIGAFKLKYNQYPGDFQNAYAFFGNTCDAAPANCNGNGNGRIDENVSTASQNEVFRTWQHLNLSEMFLANLSGQGLRSDTNYVNKLPFSKYANTIYGYIYYTNEFSRQGNGLFIGAATGGDFSLPSIRVQDAQALDLKLDDGIANQGMVYALDGTGVSLNNCSDVNTSGAGSNYNLALNGISCRMIFWDMKVQ